MGERRAARELFEDTLERRRRVLGHDHPDTLLSADNLAVDLSRLGEHRAARELLSDTLARRRRVLGHDHPDTLTSAHNLAVALPGVAREGRTPPMKNVGKPCAGEPHARFDGRGLETGRQRGTAQVPEPPHSLPDLRQV